MRFILFIFFCLTPFVVPQASDQLPFWSPVPGPAFTLQKEFDEYIGTVIAADTPGIAITVIVDGKALLTKGYGIAEVGGIDEINADTVFRLASVTKTIAAAAVGSLVQHNKLQWTNRLTDYLGNLNFNNPRYAQELTIQHLLSHRTGLIQHAYTNLVEDNVGYRDILNRMDKVPFVCAPGTCYGYQNVVFSLVGDVIEAASNETFDSFVTRNLFYPLDMRNASFGMEKFLNSKHRATPHIRHSRNGPWVPVKVNENFYRIAPAAGANASINDMNHWLLAQLGHYQDVISSNILSAMHEKNVKTSSGPAPNSGDYWLNKLEGTYYGLGWRVFDYGGRQNYVHHGGWVQGARAEIVFHSGLQMGMVFLTNSETRLAREVVPMFLQLYSTHILQE
jgi:beta-lactamase class C